MALDFPNSPTDGQVYTDAATGEQWVYESATNSWTSKGLVNTSGGLIYKGSVDITAAPPAASSGWQYSALADGTANAGYGPGITGTVAKGDIILYTGTGWTATSHSVPDATAAVKGIDRKLWQRTGTELAPETAGDDVFTSGDVKVGGTTAAPNITVKSDGGIVANTDGLVYDAATKRLGLGTSSPSGNLHVYNPATTSADIYLENTDGAYNFKLNNQNLDIYEGTSSRVRINTGGNIGIGGTLPASPNISLNANGSADFKGLVQIERDGTGDSGVLGIIAKQSGVTKGVLRYRTAGDFLLSQDGVLANTHFGVDSQGIVRLCETGNYPGSPGVLLKPDGSATFAGNVSTDGVFNVRGFGKASNLQRANGELEVNTLYGSDVSFRFTDLASAGSLAEKIRFIKDGSSQFAGDMKIGGTLPASPNIELKGDGTASFKSQAVNIDTSGRLLLGTSSSSIASRAVIQGNSFSSSGGSILKLSRGNATPNDGGDLGNLHFTDSNHGFAANISALRDGGTWTSGSSQPTRLVFSTTADGSSTPTERMKIGNDGGFSCFTTSGSFRVRNAGTSTTDNALAVFNSATDNANGTAVCVVRQDGDLENTNNAYGALSDIKLKDNVVGANSQWDDLKALQVRNYNFKPETGYSTHTQIGLIAQEAEIVSPGLVSESPDRDADGNDLGTVTKSVNYSVLYMKAVKALQEAMERIEQLEAKVAALEAA